MMLLAKFMYFIRFALYGLMVGVLLNGLQTPLFETLMVLLFFPVYYLDKKFIKVK
jgi:hypothetical protein